MGKRAATRAIDALGLLTIVAYGSWFYGFGVIVQDISDDLGVGVGVLGTVYGATTLAGGACAIAVGRVLDRRGPRSVLIAAGPIASLLYATSSLTSNALLFCVLFVVSGGMIASTGFYSFTQPLAMRLQSGDPVRAITRLTIWGAFSSPLMIPLTEFVRDRVGWQGAIRLSAASLLVVFLVSALATRSVGDSTAKTHARLRDVITAAASSRFLKLYAFASFLSSTAISALLVFQVPVMKWAGVSAATAASYAGVRGLLQLLGRVPLVAIVTRFGPWRVQLMCRSAIIAGSVALWWSGRSEFALAYVVIVGASTGALAAVDGMVAREVLPADNLATMMSLLGFIATVGGALGPVISGVVVQSTGSLGIVPLVVVASALGSVVVQQAARRESQRAPARW